MAVGVGDGSWPGKAEAPCPGGQPSTGMHEPIAARARPP
eukprot:SAG22_NODE_1818_length_3514_cov_10.657980_1_plen_38_part_10